MTNEQELIKLQREKISELETRIARATGILEYRIENYTYVKIEKLSEIRNILKGIGR